jgi:UDP-3-O-[3-hydroxymyristoyl] glucosamine N-acyltransferase
MPALRQPDRKLTVAELAGLTGSRLQEGGVANRRIGNIASLDSAGAGDICFLDDAKSLDALAETRAGACLIAPEFAAAAPPQLIVLLNEAPYRAFVIAARALFPDALQPSSLFGTTGRADGARIHPSARIEAGVTIDPLAVIGPRAEVGTGTVIAAGAAIGPDVCVGRRCAIGPGATAINALIGDRVVLQPGARLGHHGSAYRAGFPGAGKVPQIRRVIVQDDVEIGANAAVERGATRDTVIGEGTTVGSVVHIAHGAMIGRHCLIGAQSGIAGGVTIGDFVVINERVGVSESIAIGDGASVARGSMVTIDLLAGARFDGGPGSSGSGQ